MKRAWLRPRAEEDVIDNTRHYRSVGGDVLGARFFDTAFASLRAVERMSNIGSPFVGELCDIPGLRSWRVKGFQIRWYYFVTDDHLDVVRLLADARDLSAILAGTDPP